MHGRSGLLYLHRSGIWFQVWLVRKCCLLAFRIVVSDNIWYLRGPCCQLHIGQLDPRVETGCSTTSTASPLPWSSGSLQLTTDGCDTEFLQRFLDGKLLGWRFGSVGRTLPVVGVDAALHFWCSAVSAELLCWSFRMQEAGVSADLCCGADWGSFAGGCSWFELQHWQLEHRSLVFLEQLVVLVFLLLRLHLELSLSFRLLELRNSLVIFVY